MIRENGYYARPSAKKPRNDLARRLSADSGLGRMAHHFEALKHDEKPALGGAIGLVLAAVCASLLAALLLVSASDKTARTLLIFEQIEAGK